MANNVLFTVSFLGVGGRRSFQGYLCAVLCGGPLAPLLSHQEGARARPPPSPPYVELLCGRVKRSVVTRQLRRIAKQLARLNLELPALMSDHARQVAHQSGAALLLHLMVRIAWPDPEYLNRLVFGFRLTGALDRPPFYPSAVPLNGVTSRQELLRTSSSYIDVLEQTVRPSPDSVQNLAMQEQTEKDLDTFSSRPSTRHEVGARLGKGHWRPQQQVACH